ncbi:MAG: DNA polymerase/3'-5' exonuclease PolX [Myxococcota bacterium]
MARPRPKPKQSLSNQEIACALREMALFLEMDGVAYKPRAYEKAAFVVESWERPLSRVDAESGASGLEALPTVGEHIAGKIHELVTTGRIAALEHMRRRTPVDVLGLTAVEGLGPRRLRALHDALGIRDLGDLERACREGRVRQLPGFGVRSEASLLRGIELLAGSAGRRLLGHVLPVARAIEAQLGALPGVVKCQTAGSLRRRAETVGDLDFLAAARDPAAVTRAFTELPDVETVYALGDTKALVRLADGMDADLRVVEPASYGAALCYFTGSKAHSLALRRRARRRGLKLNEYGLFSGDRRLASRTEEGVYEALGLAWIPPELREDAGEIELAEAGQLPRLLEYGALRGDLKVHTDASDGDASIEEMASAARELGLEYIAITDPARDLAAARGDREARLVLQTGCIRRLNARRRGFRVLSGAEVAIHRDGRLDVADDVLAGLDVVGAGVHDHFDLARDEMTQRVIRAMESPHVDILFHPTARSIGERDAISLDIDAVIEAAVRTGTVLEIDARPERLDLCDTLVRRAVEAGALLAIDSGARAPSHLADADLLGVAVARRGWARRHDVVNTLPVEPCLARLKNGARSPRKKRGRRPSGRR